MESAIQTTILLLIATPLSLLAIVGNILIISAWILQKSVRSPQNAYYISLAVADLLVGAFVLPLTAAYTYNQGWIYGLPLCKTWLVVLFSLNPIAAYHLVAIAVDRYRTITEGVAYIQRRTIRSVIERVGIIWVLGLWVAMVLILDWEHIAKDPDSIKECVTEKTPFWVLHITVCTMIVPFYLLSRIHYKTYLEIQQKWMKRHARSQGFSQDQPSVNESDDEQLSSNVSSENKNCTKTPETKIKATSNKKPDQIAKERKAAKTLVIIIGAFFACWLPWYIFIFYDMFSNGMASPFVSNAVALIGYANSCINPIIYAFRNPYFKSAFKGMFKH